MKTCMKCGETRPSAEFSKDTRAKDGLQSRCKACNAQYCRDNVEKRRAYSAKYYQDNADKARADRAQYRLGNADKIREYRQDNADKDRAYKAEYYQANLGKMLEKNDAWRASNPLYGRLAAGAARALQRGNVVEDFSAADLTSFWAANGIAADRCYYTGEQLVDDWQLDHMTPLCRGGAHTLANLVPCTAFVNNSKGNRTAEEFATT